MSVQPQPTPPYSLWPLHPRGPRRLVVVDGDVWSPCTPGQKRVLHGVVRGLSNKEIARELGISSHAIHNYLTVLMLKAGVTNRTELTTRALVRGWVNVCDEA